MNRTDWETVIGLEIHAQLTTRSKIFSGASTAFGAEPNRQACAIDVALPGTLPVLNRGAVERAIRLGLAIEAEIAQRSVFARKNYFYPDLPKGYQISQFDQPLAGPGTFVFDCDGERREVRLLRLHLEEDAGKSIHEGMPQSADSSYVDLNRCGVPLIEIVTEPDIRSVPEADAFLTALRNTLLYLGVTDANMEEASLRCDANISLRERGEEVLNPKTELKNLNSFRFLRQALRYEIERQSALLQAGESLLQGTRLFDERSGKTEPMRAKEEAHDYRYFPEPDLVPIVLDEADVAAIAADIPELPLARADRFVDAFDLSRTDAAQLVEERARAEYFEALVAAGVASADANNWVRNEIGRWLNDNGCDIDAFPLAPSALAGLIGAVRDGGIAAGVAGKVMDRMSETGSAAADIIAEEGLEQISGSDELTPVVDEILGAHPDEVAAFRGGREQVFGFLMGEIMRATQGKANPDTVRRLLRARLDK